VSIAENPLSSSSSSFASWLGQPIDEVHIRRSGSSPGVNCQFPFMTSPKKLVLRLDPDVAILDNAHNGGSFNQ
jgi:hypothetical protein